MKIISRNKKDKPRGENNCINNILAENKKDNKRGEDLRELTNFNQLSSAPIYNKLFLQLERINKFPQVPTTHHNRIIFMIE